MTVTVTLTLSLTLRFEWWMLEEAKERNPGILTMGLSWSVPGWVSGARSNVTNWDRVDFWTDDNVEYHVR